MADVASVVIRAQLLERRRRLEDAAESVRRAPDVVRLLQQVDAALERMDHGTYGLCLECRDPIESDRLLADPLCTYCLDHLTTEQTRALQRDLDLALKIQTALLPAREVAACGWESCYEYLPAGPVSGDYCHLSVPKDGEARLFFAVGDVSGKGIAASLLMSHLQAIFRTLLSLGLPVTQVVERANHLLCEGTIASHYATLVCGEAWPSGELELANAGHCPPVVARAGACSTLDGGGLPVGLFANALYSPARVKMAPGDALVLYTDGLTEARDAAGEEYGLDRLCRLVEQRRALAPQVLLRAILDDLAAFSAAPRADDLTLMVIRRTGAVS